MNSNVISPEVVSIFRLPGHQQYPKIVPASADRDWMNISTGGWANRCLPLRIANQAGWYILNEDDFEVEWDGTDGMNSLKFHFFRDQSGFAPFNMVGYGIVSWVPPFLFRTPPGTNLWVRGPANLPKDGATPLEGIVETDWLPYSFTINWKITRPGTKLRFTYGEPICFMTPSRRFDVERLEPVIRNLESEPEIAQQYRLWHERRRRARDIQGADGSQGHLAVSDQGHYIRGETVDGERFQEHQTKLNLKPIREMDAPEPVDLDQSAPPAGHDITVQGWNGGVTLTKEDIKITRPTGLRHLLFARGLSSKTIPLKKVVSIQYKADVSVAQMAFIRFVVPDMPSELEYKAALRDPYTVLIDKNQTTDFHTLYKEVSERIAHARARKLG
jgi:hypothetical protein